MTRSPLFSRCLSPWAWTLLIPLLFLPLFSQEQQKVLEDFSSSKAGSSPNGWSPRDDRGAPYYKVLEKDGYSLLFLLFGFLGWVPVIPFLLMVATFFHLLFILSLVLKGREPEKKDLPIPL